MLFCQLFLGMGAIGSQPKYETPVTPEYEFDKVKKVMLIRDSNLGSQVLKNIVQVFGMHPVEKILVEETGVKTAEEAKPLLKAYWANKIADMSPEDVEKLKGKFKIKIIFKINRMFLIFGRSRDNILDLVQVLLKPKLEELERRFPGSNTIPKARDSIYDE